METGAKKEQIYKSRGVQPVIPHSLGRRQRRGMYRKSSKSRGDTCIFQVSSFQVTSVTAHYGLEEAASQTEIRIHFYKAISIFYPKCLLLTRILSWTYCAKPN